MVKKSGVLSFICETDKLFMRGLELEDLKGSYTGWFNDADVCRHNSHGIFPKSKSDFEAYVRSTHGSRDRIVWAIVDKKTLKHIGNICLQSIDWVNRSAEFAILMGEKDYWGKGYASEAARLLLNHGFNRLNLNRVYCGTSAFNVGMQRLALKLGMKLEGRRRDALYFRGKYIDLYEYGVLKGEFNKRSTKI